MSLVSLGLACAPHVPGRNDTSPRSSTPPPGEAAVDPETSGAASDRSAPAPLGPEALLGPRVFDLELGDEFAPAVVSLPANRAPQPGFLATHGAGGTARAHCNYWRSMLGERGILVCPRGQPLAGSDLEGGHYYPNHHVLREEVLRAVEVTRHEVGDHLAPGPWVYAGYSQGATMGALFLPDHGDAFDRLVLIEGGHSQWNVPIALRFEKSGGTRVLFACGGRSCAAGAKRSVEWLVQGGIEGRVTEAPRAGHTYGGEVAERVAEALPWLLADDARWQPR